MCLQNVSAKINNGLEMDCELEVPNGSYLVDRYIDLTIPSPY